MSAPERPSRQQLVVAPRQSHLPMLCGAAVCGCIGFGMVWALGVGLQRLDRSPDALEDPQEHRAVELRAEVYHL